MHKEWRLHKHKKNGIPRGSFPEELQQRKLRAKPMTTSVDMQKKSEAHQLVVQNNKNETREILSLDEIASSP